MTTARTHHTATLLANGEVLVAGGGNATILPSAELYNQATGKWTATGSMTTDRTDHTATLLANGQVLVAGGLSNGSSAIGTSCTSAAELYNPSTGQWTTIGSMTITRGNHTATLLPNGKVLVAGGICIGGFTYPDNSAELYDPSTGTWKASGSMNVSRANLRATLLPNGDVLVFGGTGLASSASEFYNPTKKMWTMTGQYYVTPSISGHTLTLLGTGKAQVAGGRDKYSITSYSRLYDSSTNSWPFSSASVNEPRPRISHGDAAHERASAGRWGI